MNHNVNILLVYIAMQLYKLHMYIDVALTSWWCSMYTRNFKASLSNLLGDENAYLIWLIPFFYHFISKACNLCEHIPLKTLDCKP